MNLQDVEQRLQVLDAMKEDDESAHGFEDQMYEDFVQFIADGKFNKLTVILMAKELLKSKEIEFGRWAG